MFMEPQIIKCDFVEVETKYEGTFFIPEEDYTPEEGEEKVEVHSAKYGARFSAPGYLDCTLWTIFDTLKEAKDFLREETESLED